MEAGNFPGDPVAKTPCSQCRGHGFDSWSENQIPHEAAKCSHVATEYPACCSEDRRSCMLQLRPSTAKQINIKKKKKKRNKEVRAGKTTGGQGCLHAVVILSLGRWPWPWL